MFVSSGGLCRLRGAAARTAAVAVLSLCFGAPAGAQQAEIDRLSQAYAAAMKSQDYKQAAALARQALRAGEAVFGTGDVRLVPILDAFVGTFGFPLRDEEALQMAARAIEILTASPGANQTDIAYRLRTLGFSYSGQRQYANAVAAYQRSVALYEKAYGAVNSEVAGTLGQLAGLHEIEGQYAQAEPLYKRLVEITEKGRGPDHADVAANLNKLANLYRTQGRYAEAEPLYRRALAIREKSGGPDDPDVALSLMDLATMYSAQGRYALAEPLARRSVAIKEKANGLDNLEVATGLNDLAGLYVSQGQYQQAEPLYLRSMAIYEKARGPDDALVAVSLNNLALLYEKQRQFAKAEPMYQKALEIYEKTRGVNHPSVARTLNNLGLLYDNQRQHARAEQVYKSSLQIMENAWGPDNPELATVRNNLAFAYYAQNKYGESLVTARKATAVYRQRIVAGGTGDSVAMESSRNRVGFFLHLSLLSFNPSKEAPENIADEAFQVVQLEQSSGTASAIAKMAARFAGGNDALAGLIKRKQDASDRRARNEGLLVAASGRPPQQRDAAEERRLREDSDRASKEIGAIDDELTRRYPQYQELNRPEPVPIVQIRTLLRPDEAMLVHALGGTGGNFFWVIRRDGAIFLPLYLDLQNMTANVAKVRAEMDFDGSGKAPRVSLAVLRELYEQVFAPAAPYLAGIRHVMVVPSGPLVSLPFGMLVASDPPPIVNDADYRKVDWLARHYALSVLPSVSSIQAFRQFARPGRGQQPFAGFGDPLIGGKGAPTRGNRGKVNIAGVFRNLVVAQGGKSAAGSSAAEIADVEAIRSAPRLPETADELRAMAKALKSDPKSLWLQERATETLLKRTDLSQYRTLAFATHGVMAGEVKGIGEPGLILTPPREGSLEDDGYLSAGEIAKLKLNADWVVLSACNTAAADGTPGAEGLSGLAKAFFYAGARSLLVSHWPVASEATVPLTTTMLREYEAHPELGKAEAHRKAMMALIDTPGHPEYAHPLYWAPFVVVGEGGAGQASSGTR